MKCKVKIGSRYEPKWFEKRQTSGWYSGKNPPLDCDAMRLQDVLLKNHGFARKTRLSTLIYMCLGVATLITLYAFIYFYL